MAKLNEIGEPLYLTRTPLPAVDWNTFFDAVQEAFQLHLKSAGPPGQKSPILTGDYPKQNNGNFETSFDVIISHIGGSQRAATSPDGKQRVPKGPTLRENKPHPTKERYRLITFGWWEDMLANFTIYSLSQDRANEVTAWFHKFMMRYIFDLSFFRARGVSDLRFGSRGEDKFERAYGQELYSRSLTYNVRLELMSSFEAKTLETLEVTIGGPPNPQTEFEVAERYIIPEP